MLLAKSQFLISVLTVFAVSYTDAVVKTWFKTPQNLGCQIEVSITVESFLITKPWNFIHVRSQGLQNYTLMLLLPLP